MSSPISSAAPSTLGGSGAPNGNDKQDGPDKPRSGDAGGTRPTTTARSHNATMSTSPGPPTGKGVSTGVDPATDKGLSKGVDAASPRTPTAPSTATRVGAPNGTATGAGTIPSDRIASTGGNAWHDVLSHVAGTTSTGGMNAAPGAIAGAATPALGEGQLAGTPTGASAAPPGATVAPSSSTTAPSGLSLPHTLGAFGNRATLGLQRTEGDLKAAFSSFEAEMLTYGIGTVGGAALAGLAGVGVDAVGFGLGLGVAFPASLVLGDFLRREGQAILFG